MLHVSNNRPASIAEVIEFLRTLPPDMACTRRIVEWEATEVSLSKIDAPPDPARSRVRRVELTIEHWLPTV